MAFAGERRLRLFCLLLLRRLIAGDTFWFGPGRANRGPKWIVPIATKRLSTSCDGISHDAYCPLPSVLAVFPLRKSVKLPTETITLNLYENRYLAMCDFILDDKNASLPQQRSVFGAIYGSDKPQMVPGGIGPIVPMYETGDIGTIFSVDHAEEGYRGDDPTLGRRIRIFGVAIGRFRIEKILQNGYGGGDVCTEKNEPPLPFILVEPGRVRDDIVSLDSVEGCRLLQLQRQIQEKMVAAARSNSRLGIYNSMKEENSAEESQGEEVENFVSPGSSSKSGNIRSLSTVDFFSDSLLQEKDLNHRTSSQLSQHEFRELFSFAACLKLAQEKRTAQQAQALLRMSNTLERLEYVAHHL